MTFTWMRLPAKPKSWTRKPNRQRPRFVPELELLENRLVPSFTVTNLNDTGVSGDGSLRGEIAAAEVAGPGTPSISSPASAAPST